MEATTKATERRASEDCFYTSEDAGYCGKAHRIMQPMGAATEHVGTARYESDARLWTAAPSLLAALEALAEYVDAYQYGRAWAGRPHAQMDAARLAIARARGESS